MKLHLVPLSMAALGLHVQAEPQIRDAATHAQLSRTYITAQQNDPMSRLKPSVGPDPSTANPVMDLVKQSDIICFNGLATLVPKQAILHIPASIASRINKYQDGSKILTWKYFFEQNRGWITTHEVTRRQAEGKDPLGEQFTERFAKGGNLVVATFSGGPIGMLPQSAKEEVTQTTNSEKP